MMFQSEERETKPQNQVSSGPSKYITYLVIIFVLGFVVLNIRIFFQPVISINTDAITNQSISSSPIVPFNSINTGLYKYSNTKTFTISDITWNSTYDIIGLILTYTDRVPLYNITIGTWNEMYQFKKLTYIPMSLKEIRSGEVIGYWFYLPQKYHSTLNYLNVTYTYISNDRYITETQQMKFKIPS